MVIWIFAVQIWILHYSQIITYFHNNKVPAGLRRLQLTNICHYIRLVNLPSYWQNLKTRALYRTKKMWNLCRKLEWKKQWKTLVTAEHSMGKCHIILVTWNFLFCAAFELEVIKSWLLSAITLNPHAATTSVFKSGP